MVPNWSIGVVLVLNVCFCFCLFCFLDDPEVVCSNPAPFIILLSLFKPKLLKSIQSVSKVTPKPSVSGKMEQVTSTSSSLQSHPILQLNGNGVGEGGMGKRKDEWVGGVGMTGSKLNEKGTRRTLDTCS